MTEVLPNIKNRKFDEETKIFSINDKIENNNNEILIILSFETNEAFHISGFRILTNSAILAVVSYRDWSY